jgi:AcrR family transcriptional regulator
MKPSVLYHTDQASQTRRHILNSAADIASAEGLEGISIGRLATELQMSKTGVFAHFGSKEQLQLATVETAKQIFLERVVQPALQSPRGIQRLKAMLENWLSYVEQTVFRGGCFFAAASAEFDSRPGAVRDQIAELTKAWMVGLQEEIAFAQSKKEILASIKPIQLAFELHAYVQEANWAFKLFNDKSAFPLGRRAIADRLSAASSQRAGSSTYAQLSSRGNKVESRRQLPFLLCEVSSYARCPLGELPDFCDRPCVDACWSDARLWTIATIPWKNRWANPEYS